MAFIPIPAKYFSTGTPTVLITATGLSVSSAPFKLPVLIYIVVPPINITGGRLNIGTGLSAFVFYFVNRTTGRWSDTFQPLMSVMPTTLLLMYSPHHFHSTIMWLCCRLAEYYTLTSSLLDGAIIQIGN